MKFHSLPLAATLLAIVCAAHAQPVVIDPFESLDGWTLAPSEGVTLTAHLDPHGVHCNCIRLDYDFTRGSGFAIIRKRFDLALADNYRFDFQISAQGPSNTLEFKLIDPTGDNVWWLSQPNFAFPASPTWGTVSIPKRKVSFAWGPAGANVPLKTLHDLEIVITSYNGGKGSVWLDDLRYEALPAPTTPPKSLNVLASSWSSPVSVVKSVLLAAPLNWQPAPTDAQPVIRFDLDAASPSELGGLLLRWNALPPAEHISYDVLTSTDGSRFTLARSIHDSNGGRDDIPLPDTLARAIRIVLHPTPNHPLPTLERIDLHPVAFGDSPNTILSAIAADAPRGFYPRAFNNEATFWTVTGADGDHQRVLVSEDGAIEVCKRGFSLEPFILENGHTFTWNDEPSSQSLLNGFLPIPVVRRSYDALALEITAAVTGEGVGSSDNGESTLWTRYTITNNSNRPRQGTLVIAARPFQVNPPYQFLNTIGGVGSAHAIAWKNNGDKDYFDIDGHRVIPLVPADAHLSVRFEQGEIVEHFAELADAAANPPTGATANNSTVDPDNLASAAMSFTFDLAPGQRLRVPIQMPLTDAPLSSSQRGIDAIIDGVASAWSEKLGRVDLQLPPSATPIFESARANLAYILINRDGPAIHPGARSYERAWIRDGLMMSDALLAFGHADEAVAFADWFAKYQYDSGKVPCCVDQRGPDPVAENDSHGQYISLVFTCFRFTGDMAFLQRHYPRVLKAVHYMESLRAQRMTPEYQNATGIRHACFGLLPESISHEGYSAKPMHSYWDDFFALQGFTDATAIAQLLNDHASAEHLASVRDSFRSTLADSIKESIAQHHLAYIPGCVELGDFDATSTTVALWPCSARSCLPDDALRGTFDRYWTFFTDRRDGRIEWKDYTPYEHRIVGSLVILGQRERAHQVLDFFMHDQRPPGFRHWAEVVHRDPRHAAFIGDMPHAWVGSDFLNALRTMFAFEREDGSLVLAAGITRDWLQTGGVRINRLRMPQGEVVMNAHENANTAEFRLGAGLNVPDAGLWLAPPDPAHIASVTFNDQPVELVGEYVPVHSLPAVVRVVYTRN